MMDELFLYDRDNGLFKSILKASTVMEGRYFILVTGAELNSSNLGQYISDSLKGIQSPDQKYPIALCMPPRSTPGDVQTFSFTMFFLTRDGATGQNRIKDINIEQQVSTHHTWYDWKDMNEVAINFLNTLNGVLRTREANDRKLSSIAKLVDDSIDVTRVSNVSSDNLSGIRLSFRMLMRGDCEIQDYAGTAVDDIDIPDFNIHPLHKH